MAQGAYELRVEREDGPLGMDSILGGKEPVLIMVVGADDFLTRAITVEFEEPDGEQHPLVAISFHGYNDPVHVAPPEEYEDITNQGNAFTTPAPYALPESPRPPPPPSAILSEVEKDWDGGIRVSFTDTVHVYGVVELQVLEPDGRGWTLPLIRGDGTSDLTFDTSPEGRPSLVPGQSKIVGFVFLEVGSEIVDDNGQPAELDFEPWTYE